MNILHRDLKPANIFLSDDGKSIKLGDLNVAKILKNDRLSYT
jgi:NIMA (never in mitosis gene a)-related kinase